MSPVLRQFVLPLCLVPCLSAQDPGAGRPKPSSTEIAEKTDRMRTQVVSGRPVRSHVRVAVRLKNGNKIRGIVKDGRVVERVDGLHFVQADANDDGAGIRVWYWDNSNNYVFLPYTDILDYRIQERLTTAQLLEIEKEVGDKAKAQAGKDQPGEGVAGPVPPPETEAPSTGGQVVEPKPIATGTKPADPPKEAGKSGETTDAQKQQVALLQEFPPAQGWSLARRDEIKRKLAVLGVKPTAQEDRFVAVFDAWQAACTAFGVPAQPQGETATGSENAGKGRKKKGP